MHLLGAESISLSYPNRVVLDDVTVGVSAGDRIGIVGRNGDGKSTLIRILSSDLPPDSGRVTSRGGTRIGYLRQSDVLGESATVRHAVVGDVPDHEWASDAEKRDVIHGLLGDLPLDTPTHSLSGGQRRRVALAALLAQPWDVLILDEPTNHLDMTGVRWLAEHVKKRWPAGQGAFLTVTHDRWFLDEVTTRTWEVHDATVDAYDGGYAAYVLQRVERDRQAQAEEAKRQNLMRKELAWLRRGAPARTSKPKFRIDAANALIAGEPPVRDTVELVSMATSRLGKDVFEMVGASAAFATDDNPEVVRTVIEPTDWIVGPGDRIGILGANGAGKSTLVGLLTGRVEPASGRVKRGKTVRVALLDQQLRELDDVQDDFVREIVGRKREVQTVQGELTPSQLLEKLGLGGVLKSRVKDLSGGQKRRLQLFIVLMDEPNVLILDEPTNDMDTDMLAAVEDLLDQWPGTLIVISHDRYFTERVTDYQYAVLGGHVRHLPGGVDEYLRLQQEPDASLPRKASAGAEEAPEVSLSGAKLHAARKEIASIERRVEKISGQIEKVHERMAAYDQSDFEGLQKFTGEIDALRQETDDLEARWLELLEEIE
ncbi:ABC transporter, ATP-binding protein [Brevibacterium mcbrellneri ATCC 49030]|uniref:ABC transporter, ATP-binding protein n=1 Tax=Brevibacterium mcbrellneri ATCC 49030 TaxID=585530 RepID=D4YLT0_9MICO|nr:ABC-F family ATP-binding cassette domain-containing protein [Brevibacterium mcbrellneri]EFG47813.1 ABC transporter, ATP-binding protein [Brevibacterium mcbrellneri ATCC 49030]